VLSRGNPVRLQNIYLVSLCRETGILAEEGEFGKEIGNRRDGDIVDVSRPAQVSFTEDQNLYYAAKEAVFRWGQREYCPFEWQDITRQNTHLRIADPDS
jgi:hypothetical protein